MKQEHHDVIGVSTFFLVKGVSLLKRHVLNDRQAAGSQFITPTVGRILEKLDFLEPTKIDTIGFESLLNLMDNTVRDSFDLYFGLFLFNKNSRQQLERFHLAFESLQNQLFDHVLDNLKQVLKLEEESHD